MSLYNYNCEYEQTKYDEGTTKSDYTLIEDLPFADFTFKCTDGEVKAHKCILWSRCSFFKTSSWNIDSMVDLPVDCNVVAMKKVVDFFYGRDVNFCEPDITAFNVLNMLNPSTKNITILIPIDASGWHDLLNHELPYSREQFIDEMAKHIIHIVSTGHMIDSLSHLTTEILERVFEYKELTSNDIILLINTIINEEITNVEINHLCRHIRWEYVSHIDVVDKRIVTVPNVTPEMIRQAYLVPDYPKRFAGIYAVLRKSVYGYKHSYVHDLILISGKYMQLTDIFKSADEFNSILKRDEHLKFI